LYSGLGNSDSALNSHELTQQRGDHHHHRYRNTSSKARLPEIATFELENELTKSVPWLYAVYHDRRDVLVDAYMHFRHLILSEHSLLHPYSTPYDPSQCRVSWSFYSGAHIEAEESSRSGKLPFA